MMKMAKQMLQANVKANPDYAALEPRVTKERDWELECGGGA
jgi:hypothetical protein